MQAAGSREAGMGDIRPPWRPGGRMSAPPWSRAHVARAARREPPADAARPRVRSGHRACPAAGPITRQSSLADIYMPGVARRCVESIVEQVSRQGGGTESGARTARRDLQDAGLVRTAGAGYLLPQRGDRFTEDQMRERFGVPTQGGIRTSLTSSDIFLVRNVHSGYDDVEKGRRITYDGQYYEGRRNQMISKNLLLAKSKDNANRVLYFVKQDGVLVFNGLVECVAPRNKDDPLRPGALVFELEMIDAAAERRDDYAGGRSCQPSPRMPSAPDLDMIMAVERAIFDRRCLDRSELPAALPVGIDSAKMDRILEYLEHSARITVDNASIRWSFNGADPADDSNTGRNGAATLSSTAATEEPVHILSLEERLSPDLDNDLPYNEEIQQILAECEAGRPIGKTYTADEYQKYLKQEFGIDNVGDTTG